MTELVLERGAAGVALAGSTCRRCGLVAFPAEPYGCERCGAPASELDATPLPAGGTVRSAATVHRPAPDVPAPFVVVDVVLDAGPTVTAVAMDEDGGADLVIGDRVEGFLHDGRFRFVPVGSQP